MKRIASLIACALLALPAAAQQIQGQIAQSPARNRVEVDVRATSATGTVPFDVPFEIVGNVPDRVDRIDVIYRECKGKNCPTPGTLQRDADCAPVIDDRAAWRPATPLRWQRDALTSAAPGQNLRFSVPIDPLDAQRRYVFLFDVQGTPSDEQVAAFRPRARDVIARQLAAIRSSDQPEEAYQRLRTELVNEVKTLAPCVTTADFLRPETNIDEEFTVRIAEVRDDQVLKSNAVDTFNQGAERLRAGLTTITQSDLLTVVRKLRTLAPTQPETQADLDAHVDTIKLLSLTPGQVDVVARGSAPLTPDRNLQSMTVDITADAATARANALAQTRDLLRDLSAWIKRLDRDGSLNDSFPNADDRAALVKAVDAAASESFRMLNAARNAANATSSRDAHVAAIADAVREQIRVLRFIGSDTIGTFDTFSAWYVSADAGFAYAPQVESTLPYLGANVYFRPVNKDAPLRQRGGFKRRVSATLALSLASVQDKTRKDLFNTQSLLVGGGFRVTDALRIGGGVIVYKRLNTDPAATVSSELAAAPYASISFDWNVAKQFAGLGKIFQ